MRLKRTKFGNVRTKLDGYTFDSKMEARRYQELRLLEKARQIFGLAVHERFSLDIHGVHICDYEADFCYWTKLKPDQGVQYVVEDVKGHRTDVFILKKKLMKAILGLDVLETKPR
jgi:hypothetical protein